MDYSAFKDYYFIKCFAKEEYRKQFDTGVKIYINSTEYFHNLENNFQRDFEGGIYQQDENCKGMFIASKNEMTLSDALDVYRGERRGNDVISMSTQEMKVFIHGYIMCFAIFSKKHIRIDNNGIVFDRNSDTAHEFYTYLNDYAKEKGYAFFSVLDAELFMRTFCPSMEDKGYDLSYGFVNYADYSISDRLAKYQAGKIEDIIFTKDKSRFSQQKEYRIFIVTKDSSTPCHIEEKIDISESVLAEMAYLTPEYAKQIGCKQ